MVERIEARSSGETWRADDAGTPVRLTFVAPAVFPSPLAMERSQRELRQLQRVTAPGVARIIDQGRSDDGRLFVATEVLDAPTLRGLVSRDGRLPFSRACRIVLEIGEALAEAQKVGVVHRDVSPDNVHVFPGDQVKVTSFSIAEPVTDQVFGAPEFLSPEQATGKPADQRSNIYSLGAVLYYAVTGRPPFEGDARTLLQKHQSEEPAPISQRASGLPLATDALLRKAMAKNPGRRHLTLRQFLKEVQDLAEQASAAATPAPAPTKPSVTPDDMARAKTIAIMPGSPGAASFAMPGTPAAPPVAMPSPAPMAVAHAPVAAAPRPAAPAGFVAPQAGAAAAAMAGTLGQGKAVVKAQEAQVVAKPAAVAKPGGAGQGGFRETMWFFKGEVASQQSAQGPAAGGEDAPANVLEDNKPLDDKYKDDGSLDAAGAKLSLKTGKTMMMKKVQLPKPDAMFGGPGDRMSETEFLDEMAERGRKRAYIVTGIIGGAILIALAYLILN
ncbi:MAG: serine/threonine-protein kinase [Myxococcota bacterium]